MEIRLFKPDDAIETAQIIAETLRTSFLWYNHYMNDTVQQHRRR